MISDIIILAGGFGERLWPASSGTHPKQFMTFSDGLSFLQASMKRALAVNPSGKIVIVTRRDLIAQCADQCKKLAEKLQGKQRDDFLAKACVLAEPSAKHTAAAIMLSTYLVQKISDSSASASSSVSASADFSAASNFSASAADRTILVLTSDHVIETESQFASDCAKAAAAAESGFFVCFAIPPTEPSDAYGYIKTGKTLSLENLKAASGASSASMPGDLTGIFQIDHFEEKPDTATAKKYLAEGNYWWNGGMFAFSSQMLLEEMKIHTPEIYDAFDAVRKSPVPSASSIDGVTVFENWKEMESVYAIVPSVAIDKAIAEKTSKAAAVRTSFSWTDVGNWDVFSTISENTAPHIADVKSQNNFVYSDIPVALCGVENLVVVIKNGAALVMKKGESSLVRSAVNQMKNE